jgi:prepilin-type processing-associated H-X9-DG protein
MKTTCSLTVQNTHADGFTLLDLSAVIIIFGILSALLLPALASTKPNSQAFQCLENHRQLARGWQMYAQDNNGRLAPNGDEGTQPTSPTDTTSQYAIQWCPGRMDYGAATTDPTNTAWIKLGCIYPYVKTVGVYRCPADVSTATIYGQKLARVRSMSMNAWLGPYEVLNASAGRIFYNESDLGVMGPANLWLLMDENPYSINDGYMAGYPPPGPTTAANLIWVDYPASYHNGGAAISFCDGHAQIKKWTDPVVLNMKFANPFSQAATAGNPDLPWLQAHSTQGK